MGCWYAAQDFPDKKTQDKKKWYINFIQSKSENQVWIDTPILANNTQLRYISLDLYFPINKKKSPGVLKKL